MFSNPFYKENPNKSTNQEAEPNNTSSESAEKDVLDDITEPSGDDISNITDNQKPGFNNPFGDQEAVI